MGCSSMSYRGDMGLCGTFLCWMSGATRPLRKIVLGTGGPGGFSEDEEESGIERPSQRLGLREADSRHPVSAVPHIEGANALTTQMSLSWWLGDMTAETGQRPRAQGTIMGGCHEARQTWLH